MSEILVPIIYGDCTQLYRVECEVQTGNLANLSICGKTKGQGNVGGDLISDKINSFCTVIPDVTIDLCNVHSEKYLHGEEISSSTQSITLGILSKVYGLHKKRSLKKNFDYIVITGDCDQKGFVEINQVKEKFAAAKEFAEANEVNVLFVYVNNSDLIENKSESKRIFVERVDSKTDFRYFESLVFENYFSEDQQAILNKISVHNSIDYIETEFYSELKNKIADNRENGNGYVFVGKSNSGKTVMTYNLCLFLMQLEKIYAPIWITLNNYKLKEIFNPTGTNKRNDENRIGLLEKYLLGMISASLDSEKRYALVLDNLELPYANEIIDVIGKITKSKKNITCFFLTSWSPCTKTEQLEEKKIEQLELAPVSKNDFARIVDSVIKGQFKTRLKLLSELQRKDLEDALYLNLNDVPGDIQLTLSSLQDISVDALIQKLNETGSNPISRRDYFYNLKFEQLGLFAQFVLFQFLSLFGCDACTVEDMRSIGLGLSEKKLVSEDFITEESIEKALNQLVNNYIIQKNFNNEFSVKNNTLRYFLFSCKENEFAWKMSTLFIDDAKRLHVAILYDWVQEFKSIITADHSLKAYSLWEISRFSKNTQLLEILLDETDVDINVKDSVGWTAIHWAAEYNPDVKMLQYLISKGADYLAVNYYEMTVLHLAASNLEPDVLQYVVNEHLYNDVDAKDLDGWTPLMYAAYLAEDSRPVDILVKANASYTIRDCEGDSAFLKSASNKNESVISYFIENNLYEDVNEINSVGRNALFVAASENENVKVIEKLLAVGCNEYGCDSNGLTLLHVAADNKCDDVIGYLLENSLFEDINRHDFQFGYSPLHYACVFCHNPKIIEKLFEYGADKEDKSGSGEDIYQLCVENDNSDIVRFIFEKYPLQDMNRRDGEGKMVVHHASEWNNNIEVIKSLRKLGFDFRKKSSTGKTSLSYAAVNRKVTVLNYILKHHMYGGINERDGNGWTALHHAAKENPNPESIELLVRCGADFNQRTNNGLSPLMIAAGANNCEVVNYILQRKYYSDLNEIDNYGLTCLHHAAKQNDVSVLETLYNAGVDWKIRGNFDESLLTMASLNTRINVMEFVLTHGLFEDINECDKDGYTAFQNALKCNSNIEIVKFLRSKGADFNTRFNRHKQTSLQCAAINRNVDFVRYMLEENLFNDINEVDENGCNALAYAARWNDNVEAFKLLIEYGCDIRQKSFGGKNILHIAMSFSNDNVVKYILDQNIIDINELDEDGETPLSIAIAKTKRLDYVKLLRSYGADFNIKTNDRKTYLMLGCEENCEDIVEYILSEGLHDDINCKCERGFSALEIAACKNEDLNIFKMLMSHGADVFQKNDTDGSGMLHHAGYNASPNVLNYLIENYDFDINGKNSFGETPLHLAAKYGKNEECIRILLVSGADLYEVTKSGDTCLHYGSANPFFNMVKVLIEDFAFEEVECINDDGNTALHFAARNNNIEGFQYLFRLGLNPYAMNFDNKSAIDMFDNEYKLEMEEYVKGI